MRKPRITTPEQDNARIDVLREVNDERVRQVEAEGFDEAHDDAHTDGSLAAAAGCYARAGIDGGVAGAGRDPAVRGEAPPGWPWAVRLWKPTNRRRNLVIAAALLVAEIERLDRATVRP